MIILAKSGDDLGTYMKHAQSDPMMQNYKTLVMNSRQRLFSLPVCPKCERAGLRDKGWTAQKVMYCPHCGYNGKSDYQLTAYLQDRAYR
jgi:predicted amidophosphoribosyltransferase